MREGDMRPASPSVKHRRVGDRYERVSELALENGDHLASPLLPGLDLPLSKILED